MTRYTIAGPAPEDDDPPSGDPLVESKQPGPYDDDPPPQPEKEG